MEPPSLADMRFVNSSPARDINQPKCSVPRYFIGTTYPEQHQVHPIRAGTDSLKQDLQQESILGHSGHLFSKQGHFVSERFLCSSSLEFFGLRFFDKSQACSWELCWILNRNESQHRCICQRASRPLLSHCILDNSPCHPYHEWVMVAHWMNGCLHNSQMTRRQMIQGKSLSVSHNFPPSRTKWMGNDGRMNGSMHS